MRASGLRAASAFAVSAILLVCSGCGPPSRGLIVPPNSSKGPVVTSSSLTFTSIGASAAQTVTVSETGFAGTLSETNTCSGVASVSPTQSTSPYTATVTPMSAGSCTVTFTDGKKTAPVAVSVTTTGVVVNSKP